MPANRPMRPDTGSGNGYAPQGTASAAPVILSVVILASMLLGLRTIAVP